MTSTDPTADPSTVGRHEQRVARDVSDSRRDAGGAGRRRRWLPVALLSIPALVATVLLGIVGWSSALKVRGGVTSSVVTDPNAPGYVASVQPSPVHLIAVTDEDRALNAMIVIAPRTGGGGTILWVPGELIVTVDGEQHSLAQQFADNGLATQVELADVVGFGMSDWVTVGPADLQLLAEPVAPIPVRNPDRVVVTVNGRKRQAFASGTIRLSAAQVAPFVTTIGDGEVPEARAIRAQAVLGALAKRLVDPDADTATTTGTDSGATTTTTVAPQSTHTPARPSTTTASTLPSDATAVDQVRAWLRDLGTGGVDSTSLPTKRIRFHGSFLYRPADTDQIETALRGWSSSRSARPRDNVRVFGSSTEAAISPRRPRWHRDSRRRVARSCWSATHRGWIT
ncbi:MAG: hypothetical protein R2698_01090 [Microthrixaceae bacterium]